MLISFSGIDGCGKTTYALQVADLLRQRGYKVKYIRLADRSIVRRIGNILHKVSQDNVAKAATSCRRPASLLRKILLLADVALFSWEMLLAAITGTAVVCDRYFFDSLVHLNYLGVSTKLIAKIVCALAPTPTLAFWLTLPPELAQTRDHDFTPEFYRAKHALYAELFQKIDVIKIENLTLDSTSAQVKEKILQYLDRTL